VLSLARKSKGKTGNSRQSDELLSDKVSFRRSRSMVDDVPLRTAVDTVWSLFRAKHHVEPLWCFVLIRIIENEKWMFVRLRPCTHKSRL
jgi:hypothetical protein